MSCVKNDTKSMRSYLIGADCTVARVPVDHVKLPVRDLDASRDFYLLCARAVRLQARLRLPESLGFGRDGGDDDEPFALQLAGDVGAGSHIAFTATNPRQVDEFHAAAMAAGGRDNGAPGERPYGGSYDAAFVLDPDGHNIEAVYHGPEVRRCKAA